MSELLAISGEELELVIQNTSEKLHMSKAIVEKDLWVCMILKYLFRDFKYKDVIVFKRGYIKWKNIFHKKLLSN